MGSGLGLGFGLEHAGLSGIQRAATPSSATAGSAPGGRHRHRVRLRVRLRLGLGLDGRSRAERECDAPVQLAAGLGEQDAGRDRGREAGEDGAAG